MNACINCIPAIWFWTQELGHRRNFFQSSIHHTVFFPPIWEKYHALYPNISIELVDGSTQRLNEMLLTGNIDLYIGVDVTPHSEQVQIELARERIHCCIADSLLTQYYPDEKEALLKKSRNGADMFDFINLPVLTLRRSNRLRKNLDFLFAHDRPAHMLLECDQQEIVYSLAKKGAGIGILSPTIFYQNQKELFKIANWFHVFPIINNVPENTVSLVYRKDYPLPRFITDYIQVTQSVFQEYNRTLQALPQLL